MEKPLTNVCCMASSERPIRSAYAMMAVVILLGDVLLCIVLLATQHCADDGFAMPGISLDVDYSHLQHMEGVFCQGARCVTTDSKSHAAALDKLVERKLKNKTKEKVHKDDIVPNIRPHGLLKGMTMKHKEYENTPLSQTLETWLSPEQGYSSLDYGVVMRHGRLVVPRRGLYQIFSHVYFAEETGSKKSNNTELEHTMHRYNILHEDDGEQELLQAGLTACVKSQKWLPEEENAGSYAGAITHLQAGDEISVRVTHVHLLESCKDEHYFGLHRIGP